MHQSLQMAGDIGDSGRHEPDKHTARSERALARRIEQYEIEKRMFFFELKKHLFAKTGKPKYVLTVAGIFLSPCDTVHIGFNARDFLEVRRQSESEISDSTVQIESALLRRRREHVFFDAFKKKRVHFQIGLRETLFVEAEFMVMKLVRRSAFDQSSVHESLIPVRRIRKI